jgi:hypothetical protein
VPHYDSQRPRRRIGQRGFATRAPTQGPRPALGRSPFRPAPSAPGSARKRKTFAGFGRDFVRRLRLTCSCSRLEIKYSLHNILQLVSGIWYNTRPTAARCPTRLGSAAHVSRPRPCGDEYVPTTTQIEAPRNQRSRMYLDERPTTRPGGHGANGHGRLKPELQRE